VYFLFKPNNTHIVIDNLGNKYLLPFCYLIDCQKVDMSPNLHDYHMFKAT